MSEPTPEPAPVEAWSDEFTADQALTVDPNGPLENTEEVPVPTPDDEGATS